MIDEWWRERPCGRDEPEIAHRRRDASHLSDKKGDIAAGAGGDGAASAVRARQRQGTAWRAECGEKQQNGVGVRGRASLSTQLACESRCRNPRPAQGTPVASCRDVSGRPPLENLAGAIGGGRARLP